MATDCLYRVHLEVTPGYYPTDIYVVKPGFEQVVEHLNTHVMKQEQWRRYYVKSIELVSGEVW